MGILHPGITQSELVLRSDINRRLTISEMDGNFVYLEDLSLGLSQSIAGIVAGMSGSGIPAGGAQGYVLAKKTSASYDVEWIENTGGGTSGGSGSSGTSGTSGISGSSGTSGTSGISGSGLSLISNNYFLESNDFDLLDPSKLQLYVVDQDNDNIEVALPEDFGYIEFLGSTYSSIFINTNSYVTFGGTSSEYQIMAPGKIDVPSIFIGAGDNSLQYLSIGYEYDADPGDMGDQIFRIRFEGSANQEGSLLGLSGIAWEIHLDKSNRDFIKVIVASLGNNNPAFRNERNPGGAYGISDGSKWIDIYPSLPTLDEESGNVLNTVVVAPFSESAVEGVKFVGPGVYSSIYGTTSYVKIDPLNQFGLSVGYDNLTSSPAASVISSNRYDLRLTTGENGSAVRIRPRGEAWIQPFPKNTNQIGNGHSIYIYAGGASRDGEGTGTYSGGNVYIQGGAGAGGSRGSVYVGLTSSPWEFDANGDLTLPLGGDIKDSFGASVLGGGGGAGLTELTYSQIASLMGADGLNPGSFYKITDFKTCYDQPDYDSSGNPIWSSASYKEASVSPLIVFAISGATFSLDAWQPEFPSDKLKYDFSWNATEVTGGTAYGRITERIDEFNNRTDYDHRTVLFKRYDWYSYDVSNLLAGTISFVNGAVTGEGTTFTGLTSGQIIAIPDLTPQFYKIGSIDSDTQMSLTGSFWEITGGPSKHYSIDYTMNSASYKRNNADDEPYEMTTFGGLEFDATDNYIGNNPGQFFVLSNNVFKDGPYRNNTFGNNCFNNTFDDDCEGNKIGNFFSNNITDDDFDGNFIADYFEDNIITSNFQRNHVGEDFSNNKITVSSFYRNRIGEGFSTNKIAGNNFQNNVIGNAFNNNSIVTDGDGFLKNVIGVGFNGNDIWFEFEGNSIGNGMVSNSFYSRIIDNKIGDYFSDNNIGIEGSYSEFRRNLIGNRFFYNNTKSDFAENTISSLFEQNTIYSAFRQNQVGTEFDSNTIGNSTDMGNLVFVKNRIGESVKGNLFSGEATANDIGDNFYSNVVGGYFSYNRIGPDSFFNTIGSNFLNNEIGVSFTDNEILDYFGYNRILNGFVGNNISNLFSYNEIGSFFRYNTISTDFGFGGSQARGNKIGNYFEYNLVGEYFYDNRVADLFSSNEIGDYFQLNDIKANYVNDIDFRENYNIIQVFSTNIGLSPSVAGTDGTYANLGATGGSGHAAAFDVTVSGGDVVSVALYAAGYQYATGNTMSIPYNLFGGTPGSDILITVGTVSGTPSVYGYYNTEIFKNSAGTERLSYYDANDVLTIKGITE